MTKNNYTTEELNLLMKDSIPDDCDLLLMDGEPMIFLMMKSAS